LVVLEGRNEVALLARDELKVLLRGEPTVHQHEAKLQLVVQACLDHLTHEFILRHLAFPFDLPALAVAILNRLSHQFEGHRNRRTFAVINGIQKVDLLDVAPAAVVKMPALQLTLVRPDFFLNRVVKNQHALDILHFSNHRLDLQPQVFGRVVLLWQQPRDPVMADIVLNHRRQPSSRCRAKGAQ